MNKLVRQSQIFFKRNGSTILTCVGAAGVVATTIMAVKATPKAMTLLEQAKEEKGEELTRLEKVKVAGPAYIPTIITGTSTIACIFGANVLNKHQQAAIMSAYALLDNSYKDYKRKVEELYGEGADKHVRDEIAKDKYIDEDITFDSEDKQLFYDDFSERYFESTMADVLKAEYQINKLINTGFGAYLNEFYELMGVPTVDYGDYLGWSPNEMYDTWWASWVDFTHDKVVMDDGLECYIISFPQEPTFGFEDY